jgi:hypothetical protein
MLNENIVGYLRTVGAAYASRHAQPAQLAALLLIQPAHYPHFRAVLPPPTVDLSAQIAAVLALKKTDRFVAFIAALFAYLAGHPPPSQLLARPALLPREAFAPAYWAWSELYA